jgi:hypothetical protein
MGLVCGYMNQDDGVRGDTNQGQKKFSLGGPNGFEFEVFKERFDKLNQYYYSSIKKESLI